MDEVTPEEEALCVKFLGPRDPETGCFTYPGTSNAPIMDITAIYICTNYMPYPTESGSTWLLVKEGLNAGLNQDSTSLSDVRVDEPRREVPDEMEQPVEVPEVPVPVQGRKEELIRKFEFNNRKYKITRHPSSTGHWVYKLLMDSDPNPTTGYFVSYIDKMNMQHAAQEAAVAHRAADEADDHSVLMVLADLLVRELDGDKERR